MATVAMILNAKMYHAPSLLNLLKVNLLSGLKSKVMEWESYIALLIPARSGSFNFEIKPGIKIN